MKPVLYLIDGSSYIYRAYYAIRHLSSPSGFPTNALLGFTKMLLKVMKERRPDHLAVVFDAGRSTFRHDLYADYKANRVAMPDDLRQQIAPIKAMVRAFNIPVLELEGYEADDIIGTVACDCRENGMEAVVVTGDKDLMQIVSPEVTLLDTMKDRISGIPEVIERFGVPPERVVDVLGLCGDTSDNIPGVPGIGEKTAIKLMTEYGALEEILAHAADIKGKTGERLREYAEQALLSRRLATIDCRVPITWSYDDFAMAEPDAARLGELFREYGFTGLMKELTSAPTLSAEGYRTILGEEDFRRLLQEVADAPSVALELHAASADPSSAALAGISLCWRESGAVYIPLGHRYLGAPEQLPEGRVLEGLRSFLEGDLPKTGHDLKKAWQLLRRHGIDLKGIDFDVMIASYLLNPARSGHPLDAISIELLDHRMKSMEEVTGKGRERREFRDLAVEDAAGCACERADVTFRLRGVLERALDDLGPQMTALFRDLEMPLVPVLAEMELCGVRLDTELLGELSAELQERLAEIEEKVYALAGCRFNIGSPKQLQEVLFEKLKLPSAKRTKTGKSTDIDVLTALAETYELPREILRYRSLMKLKGTYTDALPKLVDADTGCVHTSFNQAVTSTGRLSSSDPNLQNIPIRTEEGRRIRCAFVPSPGNLILSADYSQIELRVLAHLSQDPLFIDSFAREEDIHTRTASEVFGMMPGLVTHEMRRQAKTINFGVIYGLSPFGLAKELGISQKLAKEFIDNYFARHSGARAFLDSCIAGAEENGYVTTILGRRLPIPDIRSANYQARSFAQRNAVNYPVQGSAADIIKRAMLGIWGKMRRGGLHSRLILQVHDELVFDVVAEEREAMALLVREEMEHAVELKVPLKVEVKFGRNWNEAH